MNDDPLTDADLDELLEKLRQAQAQIVAAHRELRERWQASSGQKPDEPEHGLDVAA